MMLAGIAVSQNNCLDFDGTDDYISVSNLYLSGYSGITLETWVYFESFNPYSGDYNITNIIVGGEEKALLRIGDAGIDNNRPQFVLHLNGGYISLDANSTLNTGEWYHIAGTWDGSTMKLYINGIEDASVSQSGPMGTTSSSTVIGGTSNSVRMLEGKMDETRIWNDARTEAEIRQNMYRELPNPASEANLLAYYQLNETSGTTADNAEGTATYDGTLTNYGGQSDYWQTSPAIFGPKNCLDFDGTNDWISTSAAMPSTYTKEAWVYIPSANGKDNNIVSGDPSNGPHAFWISHQYNYKLSAGHGVPFNDVQDPNQIPFATWQHIAVTYDEVSETMTLYRNGIVVNQATGVAALSDGTPVNLGSFGNNSNHLGGTLDEVRIWNDVRTETEIREYMCKTLTGSEDNLIAYYNFDNTSGTVLQDFTENGNDGTLQNMDNSDWVSSSAFNTWLNTSSSSWSTTSNWSRGSVPGSSDNVGIYNYTEGTDATLSGSPTVNNMILGSSSSMTLSSGFTVNGNLILESDQALNGQTVTLGSSANLIEDGGRFTGSTGSITTTRDLSNIDENVAGLGVEITTSANMGSTTIARTHAAASNPGSILRRYDIDPTTNTGLSAELVFHYDDDELNSQTEANLKLYKSSNGTNWSRQAASSVNTSENTITLTGIDGFSYWTASEGYLPPDNALDLDGGIKTGSPDYAYKSSNVTSNTDNFTMMAWIRPDVVTNGSNGWRCIAYNGDDGGGYGIGINDSKLSSLYGGVAWHITDEILLAGRWSHVALRRNGGTTEFFLNGTKLSYSSTTAPASPSANFTIGNMFQNDHSSIYTDSFDGKIDEVIVFSEALTDEQVAAYATTAPTGSESNLVAYYTCSSSSGTTVFPFDGNSSNNLTLVNTTDDDWVESFAMVLSHEPTSVSYSSFTANWDGPGTNSSYDDGYTIQYSTSSDFSSGNATTTALNSETSKSITNLDMGTTYYYRVSGKRSNSETLEYSNIKSLTTTDGPEAPLYALDFDGSNDFVNCNTINLSGSAITMECWLKVDAFQSGFPYISQLCGTESGNNSAFLRLGDADITSGNKIEFVLYIGSGQVQLTSNTELETDTWYHIAGTYDGTNMVIYINGVLDNSSNQTGSLVSNSHFAIGTMYNGSTGDRYFDGVIDEIRVWSSARSDTEINNDMCNALEGNESGLLAYYRCDNGSGTTLTDISGNGNTGTLTNMDNTDWIDSYAMVIAEDASSVTNSGFTANWGNPGTASNFTSGYTIQYSTSSDFSSGNTTVTALSTENSKTITGLSSNTTYYYRVSGDRSGSDDPQYSNIKSLTTASSFSPVVTSNADDGGTATLRYIMANCDDGAEITFNLSAGNETIILNDLINITYPGKNYNINGENSAGSGTQVTIQVAEPGITTHKLFTFRPGTDKSITLSNMTLKGGDVSGSYGTYGSGGCFDFYNVNVGTLNNVTLSDSKAINGGAIYCSAGTNYVNMTNCTFTNTIATESGGGVSLSPNNNISITSTSFSNCTAAYSGGGLNIGCTTTATDLTVNNCTATSYDGGGIYSTGNLTLTNSVISDNSAGQNGGGIAKQYGTLSITSSTISDNDANSKGGGLYIYQTYNNTVTINNSTLSNNSATDGSGIYGLIEDDMGFGDSYDLNITLNSSTLSGNTCTGNGAGIYASDDNTSSTNVTLNNCIVTYNYNTSNYADLYASNNGNYSGTYSITGAYALSGSNNTNYTYASGMGSSLFDEYTEVSANSRYQPVIADNGGSIETVALASNSIAIGTGSTALSTDQRGFTRNSPPCIGSFEQNGLNTWEGDESSSWSTAGNWSANTIPVTDVDINIPDVGKAAFPVIGPTETVSCHDLNISSGASLTIQSASGGTGSLIISGDLSNSGTITSQSYLTGSAQAWHMVSSPAVVDISNNGWNPGDNDDFYAWLETTPGVWVNYKNSTTSPTFDEVNGSDNFVAGKGYLVAYNSSNPTKSFTGNLNTGNVTFPLANTASGRDWTYASGWNMMGNPYSSSIDWNLATRAQFQDNYAYMYDPNKDGGAGYVYINGASANAYIPPHQGFFVLATQAANGSNFTFTNSMQTHGNGSNIYKEKRDNNVLEIMLSSENHYDKTQIYHHDESEYIRDKYDAFKMFSYDNKVPQIFTISSDNIWLAINSLPELGESFPVPIGVRLPEDGVYEFKLDNIPSQLLNIPLYIEDLKTLNWHRVDNNSMSFNASAGDTDDRFVLHMGVVGLNENQNKTSPIQVYSHGKTIFIINNQSQTGDVMIVNILGQHMDSFKLDGSTSQSFILNVSQGVYLVYLQTIDGNVHSEKVIIK